jgi:hypothetical protein
MMIKKLEKMPYAQAHVEIDEKGNAYLFSYNTLVAGISVDGWCWCRGTYSQTTRRHIGAFAKEYTENFSYHDFKKMAADNAMINCFTGEVEFWC